MLFKCIHVELQTISELALHSLVEGSCSYSYYLLFEPLRNYAQVLVFLINTLILVSLTERQAIKQDENWS